MLKIVDILYYICYNVIENKIKGGENMQKYLLNNLIIERLITERRTANAERQKEINDELTKRYNIKYKYIKDNK